MTIQEARAMLARIPFEPAPGTGDADVICLAEALICVVEARLPEQVATLRDAIDEVVSRYENPKYRDAFGELLPRYTKRSCRDCGTPLRWERGQWNRQRCKRCALKHWRANNPEQTKAQRQRYSEKDPDRIRALVRLRVAKWRARLDEATPRPRASTTRRKQAAS